MQNILVSLLKDSNPTPQIRQDDEAVEATWIVSGVRCSLVVETSGEAYGFAIGSDGRELGEWDFTSRGTTDAAFVPMQEILRDMGAKVRYAIV
jgi:hypothetical protein